MFILEEIVVFSFLVNTLCGLHFAYVGITFVSKVLKIVEGSDVAYFFRC